MGKNAVCALLICFTLASVQLVEAQQAVKMARIGYLHPGSAAMVSAVPIQGWSA